MLLWTILRTCRDQHHLFVVFEVVADQRGCLGEHNFEKIEDFSPWKWVGYDVGLTSQSLLIYILNSTPSFQLLFAVCGTCLSCGICHRLFYGKILWKLDLAQSPISWWHCSCTAHHLLGFCCNSYSLQRKGARAAQLWVNHRECVRQLEL